jgi:CRISPR/Cas system-associated protein Csm6
LSKNAHPIFHSYKNLNAAVEIPSIIAIQPLYYKQITNLS